MKTKVLALSALAALVGAASSLGGSAPVTAATLAVGKMNATTIHAQAGTAILSRITMLPGSTFGWHEHGAPVAVVVKSGTLTVLDPSIQGCKPFSVGAGAAFVEPAHHLHLARNDGTTAVVAYALYLGVDKTPDANLPGKAPTGCTG